MIWPPPKAGQLWSWHVDSLVYLVKRKHKGKDGCINWVWIDMVKGCYVVSPLSVGRCEGWELLVDV